MLREFHNRWEFDLKSSPESLWPFVADTNRFNRDTGVPQIEISAAGMGAGDGIGWATPEWETKVCRQKCSQNRD